MVTLKQLLNNKNFENELEAIDINNGIPITFTDCDYNVIEGRPKYTDSSLNGRSGSATAVISRNTLAIYTSENIEYPYPINWSKTISNTHIYNRAHIIAYSLSAKNTEEDNIFIGTEYLNQISMKKVESDLYKEIKADNRVYIYKVTPIYKEENHVIPFGILFEAVTIDNGDKKQYCKFCYNIQPGKTINYKNGSIDFTKENSEDMELIKYDKDKTKKDQSNNKYKKYVINIRTKTFHLENKKCWHIQSVEPKYIQGTKASDNEIIEKGFRLCEDCTNYSKELIKT